MRVPIFPLLIAILLASGAAAQSPRSRLFDSFVIESMPAKETEDFLQPRILRFAAEVKRMPSARPVILHYRERVRQGNRYRNAASSANTAQVQLSQKNGTYIEGRVVMIDGGVRDEETLEFWLMPKGAEPPVPTPTYSREQAINCPMISAYQDGLNFDKTERINLVSRVYPETDVKFDWSVDSGRIVESDHYTKAAVDVSGVKSDTLVATVRIDGLPPECKRTDSVIAYFGRNPKLYDRFFNNANGDVRARLDAFMSELSRHTDKHGYIYVYGDREKGGRDTAGRLRLINQQVFLFRNFHRDRVTVLDAGYRNGTSTDLWIVPPGQEPPKPTPTVEREFVERRAKPAR